MQAMHGHGCGTHFEADTGDITDGVAAATETGDQDLILRVQHVLSVQLCGITAMLLANALWALASIQEAGSFQDGWCSVACARHTICTQAKGSLPSVSL